MTCVTRAAWVGLGVDTCAVDLSTGRISQFASECCWLASVLSDADAMARGASGTRAHTRPLRGGVWGLPWLLVTWVYSCRGVGPVAI